MNDDRCVCCGAYVPEGRQVCLSCERRVFLGMSIERFYGAAGKIFTPVCDNCGKELPGCETFWDAVEEKKDAGWLSARNIWGEWDDVCPDCQRNDNGPSL